MLDCYHEWKVSGQTHRQTTPPKVNLKCEWCGAETWEVEQKWLAYSARPTVENRLTKVEAILAEMLKPKSKNKKGKE